MITYKKRKKLFQSFLPYMNIVVVVLIMSAFMALNIKVSENSETVIQPQLNEQAPTVDISGEWVGTMTEDYGAEARYDYRVIFDQGGDDLEGFTFQETTNYHIDIYAESDIAGSITGNDIYFYEEATLLLDNLSLDHWCRIEVRLNYQVVDGQETLIGTWDSAEEDREGCQTIDGRVVLTRQSN